MDFKLVLPLIPSWMVHYSTAPAGCIHHIQMTVKAYCSPQQYMAFTHALHSLVTDTLYTCLESEALYFKRCLIKLTFLCTIIPRHSEGLHLWMTRCNPPFVGSIMLCQVVSLTLYHSPLHTIHSVSFTEEGLHEFPLHDLERLKDPTEWLSDNHIDFALQCVIFSLLY